MKVVVTSTGTDTDSRVEPRFGRAPYFLLVDTASGEFTALDNAGGVEAVQGAGVQAAEAVSRSGAECLLTGHCGPKAYRALAAAGIVVYTGASGTISEAVEQLHSGELERADGPTVSGHWA